METRAYVDSLCEEGALLADCARDHLGLPVPSCPGWEVADAVDHLGRLHHGVAGLIERRATDPERLVEPEAPGTPQLVDWFEQGVDRLAGVLLATPDEVEVWSWSPERNVGFWRRRMAVETALHRWDVEAAVGNPRAIDKELASEGIDEFVSLYMPRETESLSGSGETIHVHSTDAAVEWNLSLGNGLPRVSRGHQKATVAARAGASDLLLLLWRRIPIGSVEVFGDWDLLVRFLAWMDLE